MGRIKSTMIKKTAIQLMEKIDNFNDSFEHNKKLLKDTMPSKPIKNKVAGYITRLKRQQTEDKHNGRRNNKEGTENTGANENNF